MISARSYVKLVNQIFGILTRELYSGSYQILKYTPLIWQFVFAVELCYCEFLGVSQDLYYDLYIFINNRQSILYIIVIWTHFGVLTVTYNEWLTWWTLL